MNLLKKSIVIVPLRLMETIGTLIETYESRCINECPSINGFFAQCLRLDKDFVLSEIEAHAAIIEKIEKRNPEASREEMRKHINEVHRKLETAHTSLAPKEPLKN